MTRQNKCDLCRKAKIKVINRYTVHVLSLELTSDNRSAMKISRDALLACVVGKNALAIIPTRKEA